MIAGSGLKILFYNDNNSNPTVLINNIIRIMLKKLNKIDFTMLALAFLSLIVAETLWYLGDRQGALFVGLWVPSILGFAIYLKLLLIQKK
jgi:hypothetical protein